MMVPFDKPPRLCRRIAAWALGVALFAAGTAGAQDPKPVLLDEVVAVVNNQPILASDVEDEIQMAFLDATHSGEPGLTRQHALEQLISRALVQQQIREQDAEAAMPTADQVDARMQQLRHQIPACTRADCATELGWKALLAEHGTTPERAQAYIRYRMEILRFIEQQFRPQIRISQQEIEDYYRDKLAPQYSNPSAVPPLDTVSKRIGQILLEQKVTGLFDQWLTTLHAQGNVEILDPAFVRAGNPAAGSGR